MASTIVTLPSTSHTALDPTPGCDQSATPSLQEPSRLSPKACKPKDGLPKLSLAAANCRSNAAASRIKIVYPTMAPTSALRLLCLLPLLIAFCPPASASPTPADDADSWAAFTRSCAALHNEGCGEQNLVPGPCTRVEKCLAFACDENKPGSCAVDPTLQWCDYIDCKRAKAAARH